MRILERGSTSKPSCSTTVFKGKSFLEGKKESFFKKIIFRFGLVHFLISKNTNTQCRVSYITFCPIPKHLEAATVISSTSCMHKSAWSISPITHFLRILDLSGSTFCALFSLHVWNLLGLGSWPSVSQVPSVGVGFPLWRFGEYHSSNPDLWQCDIAGYTPSHVHSNMHPLVYQFYCCNLYKFLDRRYKVAKSSGPWCLTESIIDHIGTSQVSFPSDISLPPPCPGGTRNRSGPSRWGR